MTPEQDKKNLYQWRITDHNSSCSSHPYPHKGWSAAGTEVKKRDTLGPLLIYYYRRAWNWDLTKVIDEIPIDEEEMDYMLDMSNDPLEQTVNTSNELPPWDLPQSI